MKTILLLISFSLFTLCNAQQTPKSELIIGSWYLAAVPDSIAREDIPSLKSSIDTTGNFQIWTFRNDGVLEFRGRYNGRNSDSKADYWVEEATTRIHLADSGKILKSNFWRSISPREIRYIDKQYMIIYHCYPNGFCRDLYFLRKDE